MKRILFFAIICIIGILAISGCNKPETYTVSYNANGGIGTMQQQVFTEGKQQALRKNTFTHEGYDFSGWNGNGANYLDEQIISVNSDLTLYALWTAKPGSLAANVPEVQTNQATRITATAATLNGNVISNGGAYITERGFIFGTDENYLAQRILSDVGDGSFFVILTFLSPNTTYYFKAYACNSEGTAYGDVVSFTTPSQIGTRGETFIDSRDGNIYSTINIGSQTWMGENLRYEGDITLGSWDGSFTVPYRYNPNNNAKNVPAYGYLYNWPAVMNGASGSTGNPSGVQGICPEGWHLPSVAEWSQLVDYLGGEDNSGAMLAGSANLWTDLYDDIDLVSSPYFGTTVFNALPAGYTKHYGNPPSAEGGYYEFGETAAFYTTTDSGDWTARFCSIGIYSPIFGVGGDHNKCSAFSVRCIRDN